MKFCSAVLEEQRIRDWEGRTDRRTEERPNGRTDIRITIYPLNFVCGGFNKNQRWYRNNPSRQRSMCCILIDQKIIHTHYDDVWPSPNIRTSAPGVMKFTILVDPSLVIITIYLVVSPVRYSGGDIQGSLSVVLRRRPIIEKIKINDGI